MDVRATRRFRIGKVRLQAVAELYNALNDRISQANTETWGTNAAPGVYAQSGAFLRPSLLLGGRLFKFGAQVGF